MWSSVPLSLSVPLDADEVVVSCLPGTYPPQLIIRIHSFSETTAHYSLFLEISTMSTEKGEDVMKPEGNPLDEIEIVTVRKQEQAALVEPVPSVNTPQKVDTPAKPSPDE